MQHDSPTTVVQQSVVVSYIAGQIRLDAPKTSDGEATYRLTCTTTTPLNKGCIT